MAPLDTRHLLLVTGRLAEPSLQEIVPPLARQLGFHYTIQALPITVAALMTPTWIARHLQIPPEATEVILPGYCAGNLEPVQQRAGLPVQRGPKDLFDLGDYLGAPPSASDYGSYRIEIVAEINHAPDIPIERLLSLADSYRRDGADLIDLGCNPDQSWAEVATAVRELRHHGHRVSIDSFNSREIELAVSAGAELVLSVNSSNVAHALDWDAQLVLIPDDPATMSGLEANLQKLAAAGKSVRLDPVLEPIGFGFYRSVSRYAKLRDRYPDVPMMMGVGNLTELTACDSAGVNLILLAICEELRIHSVLTTQVIPWAQSSVRELAAARQLVHHAVSRGQLPKHVDDRLVMLRDPRVHAMSEERLQQFAAQLKDPNYRLLVQPDGLHLLAAGIHLQSADPFELFDQLARLQPRNLDVSHAFYLGYELAKATTALTLGKQYRQDEALDWGLLTVPEPPHHHRPSGPPSTSTPPSAASTSKSDERTADDPPPQDD